MDTTAIIQLYVDAISPAIPFAVTWFLCDLVLTTVLRVALGGRLTFKGVG